VGFLGVGAVAAWWFRRSVDQGEIKGLQAQIGGLKEAINAFEQRHKLAVEQEQAAMKAAQSAREEIATLKATLAAETRTTEDNIRTATDKIRTILDHVREILRAQEGVSRTLGFAPTSGAAGVVKGMVGGPDHLIIRRGDRYVPNASPVPFSSPESLPADP
jgi:hypothetical protein